MVAAGPGAMGACKSLEPKLEAYLAARWKDAMRDREAMVVVERSASE